VYDLRIRPIANKSQRWPSVERWQRGTMPYRGKVLEN